MRVKRNSLIDILEDLERHGILSRNKMTKPNKDVHVDKCDIIDIADKEMKRIDSSEMDSEFKKIFSKEYTKNLIDLVAEGKCKKDDLESYLKVLGDHDILDLRLEDTNLYIKTTSGIIPFILSQIMGIAEECINKVPIHGKYNFYFIDCKKYGSKQQVLKEYKPYDWAELVDILLDIGGNCIEEDFQTTIQLTTLIQKGIIENWIDSPEEIRFQVDVEDKVVAIAFNQFIPAAKTTIGAVLCLNPEIFIDVSTPLGTVLLIDTRRWYLEPNFGGTEWSQ